MNSAELTDSPCHHNTHGSDCHGYVLTDGTCECCGHKHIHCELCDDYVDAEFAASDCVCVDCAEPEDDEIAEPIEAPERAIPLAAVVVYLDDVWGRVS